MAKDTASQSTDRATLTMWLNRIDGIDSLPRLMATVRDLHAAGVSVFFQYSGEPDRNDRTRFRAEIHQGQLGLPLPFYSAAIPGAQERWKNYQALIAKLFQLAGVNATTASRDADAVFRIEAALAAESLPFSGRFDPTVSEHVQTIQGLTALAPHFEWRPFLDRVKYSSDRPLNVTSTKYLAQLDRLLADTSIEDMRAFVRWQLMIALGSALPSPLSDEYVAFTSFGQKPSRFDDCQLATIKAMGVELSRQYSQRLVGTETRAEAKAVAEGIRKQMANAVLQTPWLSQNARRNTKLKLDELSLKVGFPDSWPATGTFPLRADGFLENTIGARTFEQRRTWQRVHSSRRRDSWETVVYPNAAPGMAVARLVIPNGYPDIFSNSIFLTAAYLRPPLFDGKAPLEVQYGTFGTMVGHEFTHVLDNHQYDHLGQTHELWSAADMKAHDAQEACIRDQANQFAAPDGARLDAELILDESLADYGGTIHAYAALSRELGTRMQERGSDGFTRAQRFFVTYAQSWCNAERPELATQRNRGDHHAINRFRVNAPLSNMPEFAKAFSCKKDAPMVKAGAARCVVW